MVSGLMPLVVAALCCSRAACVPVDLTDVPEPVTTVQVRNVKQVQTSVSESRVTRRVLQNGTERVSDFARRAAAVGAGELLDEAASGPTGFNRSVAVRVAHASDANSTSPAGGERVQTVRAGEGRSVTQADSSGAERVSDVRAGQVRTVTKTGPEGPPRTTTTVETGAVRTVTETGPHGAGNTTTLRTGEARTVDDTGREALPERNATVYLGWALRVPDDPKKLLDRRVTSPPPLRLVSSVLGAL